MTISMFRNTFKEEHISSMKAIGRTARSDLVSFLSKNNFLVRGRGAAAHGHDLTHTLMDGSGGGKICLPDSAIEGFMAAYGADLADGKDLFVVERRTSIFKMHFDLDFKKIHSKDVTESIVKTIQEAVAGFVATEATKESWCVVCAVLDSADRTTRKAPGLHIVFPWLQVDTDMALWLRSSVVSLLRSRCGQLEQDWETVVDIAVLTTNGLRMVGSDKCRDCSTCHNSPDARLFCGDCNRRGRVPEGKIYLPWLTIPEAETKQLLADLCANLAYGAHMCSTRVPSDMQQVCPWFSKPTGAPPPSVRTRLKSAETKLANGKDHSLTESAGGKLRLRTENVELSDALRAALQLTLASHHQCYAALEPYSLERLVGPKNGDTYCLKVRGFGCRFCQNKRSEHGQQTVYFIISARGIVQRCYSRKPLERVHGLCEKFASAPTPLHDDLMLLLYPRSAEVPVKQTKLRQSLATIPTSALDGNLKRNRESLEFAERMFGDSALKRLAF
jgi:hypothetical protein